MNLPNTINFDNIQNQTADQVGVKCLNLGTLLKHKLPVPPGFCITTQAYRQFMATNNLNEQVRSILREIDPSSSDQINQASSQIKKLILKSSLPTGVQTEVIDQFEKTASGTNAKLMNISASCPESHLDARLSHHEHPRIQVSNIKNLIDSIITSWASLYDPQTLFLSAENAIDPLHSGIAIQVQFIPTPQSSGVMFTSNLYNHEPDTLVIESIWGLSIPLMHGQVTPDHFEINRNSGVTTHKLINHQTQQLTNEGSENIMKSLSIEKANTPSLTPQLLSQLTKYGKLIQKKFRAPQDVEWICSNNECYVLSTRPLKPIHQSDNLDQLSQTKKKPLLVGTPASPGAVTGTVKIIIDPEDFIKVKPGDILVTSHITPDHVYHLRRAAAVITDHGGQASHAAIISRELSIPCIVGTRIASKQLNNNQVVTVDAHTGKIYLDKIKLKPYSLKLPKGITHIRQLKTKTKLYVNMSEPDIAPAISAKHVDGVGLLRAEFMIAEYIGTHPRQLLFQGKRNYFVNKLAEGITQICDSFEGRPVIYRTTDFTSEEYRKLKGGFRYETPEPNPMIGLRGCGRYLKDPKVFLMELDAIKKVRNKGYTNLHLMIPFIQTVDQLKEIKKLMYHHGVKRTPNFFMYMALEVPSNLILLEDFINVGIDGISIGSNDLTALILGADRDNEAVANVYNEQDPAVLSALETIIKTCKKHKIESSICGQAPSIDPDFVQKLVKWGITSISVSPDVIDQTRITIKRNEINLSKNKHRRKKKK